MSGAGRFAPSPSADLHIGNLRTAVLAWLFARRTGRRFLVRIEDLDDRAHSEVAHRQLDDLAAIGVTWDEEPQWQSKHRQRYDAVIIGGGHNGLISAAYLARAGLKTVVPSNPYDAKGLLISAIEDDDPVIFLEPKRLYNGPFDGHHDRAVRAWAGRAEAEVPDGYYRVPLGKAAIVRAGEAVTVLAYGTMVHVAMAAAEEAQIDAEIIDLRTLIPLDIETIEASVRRTGRCVIVHEATRTSGFGAELIALVQEHCFYHLEAPIERVTGWDTPYPHAFEWEYFPGPARVIQALRRVMGDAT